MQSNVLIIKKMDYVRHAETDAPAVAIWEDISIFILMNFILFFLPLPDGQFGQPSSYKHC